MNHQKLKDLINNNRIKLFVGVGNLVRCDDGIGVWITNRIKARTGVIPLSVEVSLENYISKINALQPDILVLIDCLNFEKKPGYWDLFPVEEIKDFTLHTHNITLKRISEFFKMPAVVLGIQPAKISIGLDISPKVLQAGRDILDIINSKIETSQLS